MSEVRVNNIVDFGGKGAPTFDNGAVISGVSSLGNQAKIGSNVTITSGGINVSGVTTAATLSGNLTGDVNTGFVTATSAVIGSGVTINAGGLNITGVVTATSFTGDGSTMTGVAMSIAPLAYNPDVNDSIVTAGAGIGITFDHRILAGSGNITLSIATNAGAAGTTVENFGVGSSVTIQGRKAIIDPTSDLNFGETYHISYPSGCFTNTGGDVSYVGTAYTFGVKSADRQLWSWGRNQYGQLGLNDKTDRSSPTQVPGTSWANISNGAFTTVATKTDGTLWSMGRNTFGQLGLNNLTQYSSPVQIGTDTTWSTSGRTLSSGSYQTFWCIKTDGTLWGWGSTTLGQLGQNQPALSSRSSPTQVPGTTWSKVSGGSGLTYAIKTDGTLWGWGSSNQGQLAQNNRTNYSSPVQIPGTAWSDVFVTSWHSVKAIKTDGTYWAWGFNTYGQLGHNNTTRYSSPVQLPGTTWRSLSTNGAGITQGQGFGTKTDGTLWTWGLASTSELGQNTNTVDKSSPVQIPGTTWSSTFSSAYNGARAIKTDGTLWTWGQSNHGQGGHSNRTTYSSPKQLGSDTGWDHVTSGHYSTMAIKKV